MSEFFCNYINSFHSWEYCRELQYCCFQNGLFHWYFVLLILETLWISTIKCPRYWTPSPRKLCGSSSSLSWLLHIRSTASTRSTCQRRSYWVTTLWTLSSCPLLWQFFHRHLACNYFSYSIHRPGISLVLLLPVLQVKKYLVYYDAIELTEKAEHCFDCFIVWLGFWNSNFSLVHLDSFRLMAAFCWLFIFV